MVKPRNFVGKYTTYPDSTGRRQAEGGKRLNDEVQRVEFDGPLITIITVCWNSAATIEQTIKSVLRQTYPNIEYLIIDGNSTDNTLEIIRKYETDIDYYVSEPDDGLYYAMNKGLELAQGDYILILNSDDWYTLDCVEKLTAAAKYSGCDFVSALAIYVDEDTGSTQMLRAMPFDHSLYIRMPLRHETMLIPASLYEQLGPYDTNYRILSDREYTARLFEANVTHYQVAQGLLNFRTSGISNTNIKLLTEEKDRLLKTRFEFLDDKQRELLNDPNLLTPAECARIANAHLDQPELVKACRSLLADRKASGGKKWRTNDLETIAIADDETYPKVSVILPFYQAEDTIGASLDSVLGQSLAELEVLCINDCAIDSSQTVVDGYHRKDRRVKILKNTQNIGLGASRNAGIRAAAGRFIFHLDPDDTIPVNALEHLYELAIAHGSVMVKGAYSASQGLHEGAAGSVSVKYPCGIADQIIAKTNLKETPRLLNTTEGHWSYLYDANLARQAPYPTDLKMGQDSLFLVKALAVAGSITLTPNIIYNYEANPNSAMNRFSSRKFFDALEWRRRAWHILNDSGYKQHADHILINYWSEAFFAALESKLSKEEYHSFFVRLNNVFRQSGFENTAAIHNPKLRRRIQNGLDTVSEEINSVAVGHNAAALNREDNSIRVATLSTRDHGGAGQGSQRRVEALRSHGVDAQIYCIFKATEKPFVHQVTLDSASTATDATISTQEHWKKTAVATRKEYPDLRARELFSKATSIVNFEDLHGAIDDADIVHLHWVVGMFDYANAPRLLGDKPVVWTLADMNAFTGGCHYSEGCSEYRNECRSCPMIGPSSELPHETWKIKHHAYQRMHNLHIVCPSQWLADRAAESSLLKGRPIRVIPNAFPVERFQPTNKAVARKKLGLPLDKKLVAFGADSLNNSRKGGDLLRKTVERLRSLGQLQDIEGVFFGSKSIKIGIKAHHLGHISDEEKLSLVFAAADVYAFPSREDNAPLTVAEAMLSGTPVVGFQIGNIPEILTHLETGYIAQPENIDDFASGLIWALEDAGSPEAIMRSVKCYLAAKSYNDPERAAQRHIALYNEMLEESH